MFESTRKVRRVCIQSCLFRCNSAEFTVWGTIQSCLFRCNSGHHSAFIIDQSAFIIRPSSFIHQSTSNQKSIKNQSKIVPKSNQNRSWRRLGGVLDASWGCLGDLFDLRSIFLVILEGLGGQLGSILAPKTDPKARNFGNFFDFVTNIKLKRFSIAFGFHFGGYRNLKS